MNTSTSLASQAVEILNRDFLKLPAGVRNGSVERLVECLIGAAAARIEERRTLGLKPMAPAK
ncbi:MAG TPA: hypothetical protein VGI93_17815 [Steroidobacteraceae bacterium]|jgi:hypothetical protein